MFHVFVTAGAAGEGLQDMWMCWEPGEVGTIPSPVPRGK